MRFTIRELLLVTVAVGLGVGWWVDRWQLSTSHSAHAAQQQKSLYKLEEDLFKMRDDWHASERENDELVVKLIRQINQLSAPKP